VSERKKKKRGQSEARNKNVRGWQEREQRKGRQKKKLFRIPSKFIRIIVTGRRLGAVLK